MIHAQNLSVEKGGNRLLRNVSFDINPGEINVIVGKNGAGKSTLLETLCGNNELVEGSIRWDGADIRGMSLESLAMRRAVLSQKINISFPIKVHELVEMGTYVIGDSISQDDINYLITSALQKVEMLDFKDRAFNTLSGGEQKRIMLAKCLVQLNAAETDENKYLFLDEPTSSLDINQQHSLIERVKTLAKEHNVGIFAVLHDINLAAICADKILMIKSGRIMGQGRPTEILNSEMIKKTLDIDCIVQSHPVLECPFVTAIPRQTGVKI